MRRGVFGLTVIAAVTAIVGAALALVEPGDASSARQQGGREVVTTDLNIPWGLVFLPGGDALVAERRGHIVRVPKQGGKAKRVMTVPGVDQNAGEGGLLGLALSPNYRRDRLVYAYLTTRSDNRIVRFKLGKKLDPVLTGIDRGAFIHNGGRIAFGPDGMLYAGTGDADRRMLAQDRDALNGKILRMRPNGGVPADNPFGGSLVWSLGHRNVQGLAWDRGGRLLASELGENRADEINLIKPGRNYGWPEVEGRGDTQGGRFTNPQVTWRPSEASPSGVAIRGRTLYVAALRGERLWKIPLRGNRAKKPKPRLVGRYGRLRTVEVAPDRSLWIATSNGGGDDRIIRLGRR